MRINTNLKNFRKQHLKKKNQIIYYTESLKNKRIIENLIENFLIDNNSFIFESVEKGKIRGRYTIFGKNPDKIWEFKNNKVYLFNKQTKKIINKSPYIFLKKMVEEFKFQTPKNLPPICSLLAGFFSYDIIRYIEKIPNNCVDDLNLPDIRILRPTSIIIHDNVKKKIFYIVNCYNDERINDYQSKLKKIKQELVNLKKCTKYNFGNSLKIYSKQNKNKKIKSNLSKKYFKNIAKKFPSKSSKELAEQLQGKTWEEWVECFEEFEKIGGYRYVGLPRIAEEFPGNRGWIHQNAVRIHRLKFGMGNSLRFHLLGIQHSINEVEWAKNFGRSIIGVDSSAPLKAASSSIMCREVEDFRLLKERIFLSIN